jgi:mycothiol synthase
MSNPQLQMVHETLGDENSLPPLPAVPGFTLRTFQPGDEEGWCACFAQWTRPGRTYAESGWTPEKLHGEDGWFSLNRDGRIETPGNLFLVVCDADQSICTTACCWTTNSHPAGMGELGWVASTDRHRGKGLGNLVTLAVLHRLKQLGKSRARLNTDDWRVPAIKAYLTMGFTPSLEIHDSMPARWEAIHKLIGSGAKAPNIAPPPAKL